MIDTKKTKQITTANRAAWEQAAPIHCRHNQSRLIQSYSNPGFTDLDAIETERLNALGMM